MKYFGISSLGRVFGESGDVPTGPTVFMGRVRVEPVSTLFVLREPRTSGFGRTGRRVDVNTRGARVVVDGTRFGGDGRRFGTLGLLVVEGCFGTGAGVVVEIGLGVVGLI